MNKKQIVGIVVAAVIFVGVGASSIITNVIANNMAIETASETISLTEELWALTESEFTAPEEDYIGVVSVVGTIQEQTTSYSYFATDTGEYQHDTMIEFINDMMVDDYNKGILLYIDSPGGTIYESEELYSKIVEYQETTGREVWTYMAHYAASGGYYVTASADKIYANRNTTTGSIGVIISAMDTTGLYEKLGIEIVNITSGENKATDLSSEEQIAIYQAIVDESYDRFVEIIVEGRNLSTDEVLSLADGRVYTASQALELGLIDEISTYEDVQEEMSYEFETSLFYTPSATVDLWSSLLATVDDLMPKSEAEILVDLTEEFESGVPMYYAEQLQ